MGRNTRFIMRRTLSRDGDSLLMAQRKRWTMIDLYQLPSATLQETAKLRDSPLCSVEE